MPIRTFSAIILALGLSSPVAAEFQLPACNAAAAWAADFSADSYSQVTPAVRLPKQLRDDALLPVFGLPIMAWQPSQFSAAGAHLGDCVGSLGAQDQSGPASPDRLQDLRRAVLAAQTPVRRIGQARDQVAAAVKSLLSETTTAGQLGALEQALAALRGIDVRAGRSTIAAPTAGAIATLVEQYPYLLPSDAHTLRAGLLQRRKQLQQQAREAEIEALAALEQARAELDAADVSADGLATLDRLQRHPALAGVQPSDARRFIDELNAKRERIRAELQWQRQQAAMAELGRAQQQIADLPLTAASLAELDRLAALPALRELPIDSVRTFRLQLDQQRRAILAELEQQRLLRINTELGEIRRELAALPLTAEGRATADRLGRHPVLNEASHAQKAAFYRELQAKQVAIAEAERQRRQAEEIRLADQALAELDQSPGVSIGGELTRLGDYWQANAQAARDMERDIGVTAAQHYWRGFKQRYGEQAAALLPEFRQALAAIPADLDALPRLRSAVTELTGMEDPTQLPNGYDQAVLERGADILSELQARACERRWRALGLDSDEAAQALWSDARETKLGDFLCRLMDAGHQVLGYHSPYPFFSTHTLQLSFRPGGVKTLLLKPGEVSPGREMLLGYQINDAHQQRELSRQDWEQTVAELLPQRNTDPCAELMRKSADALSETENITLMGCMLR